MNPNSAGPTDEEMDRNWTPSGRRPQSTIARSFSAELMDIFRIENSVADLDERLDKRKQQVTNQTSELEALEKRIREMEERLMRSKQPAVSAAPNPRAQRHAAGESTRAPQQAPPPISKDLPQRSSRPGTAKAQQQQQVRGGALPPTPTASEGEYELVPRPENMSSASSSLYGGGDNGRLETRSFTDMVIVSKDGDTDS